MVKEVAFYRMPASKDIEGLPNSNTQTVY